MKIEFIKETKLGGNVFYYTTMNGIYVNDSLSTEESEARKLFELLKEDHTALENKKIILESIEIY